MYNEVSMLVIIDCKFSVLPNETNNETNTYPGFVSKVIFAKPNVYVRLNTNNVEIRKLYCEQFFLIGKVAINNYFTLVLIKRLFSRNKHVVYCKLKQSIWCTH